MILEPLTDDALAESVVPWARLARPDLIVKLDAQRHAPQYRRLLGRLVEIRWSEDREHREQMPMLTLHESALVLAFEFRGTILKVSGRYAPRPWQWTFAELAQLIETYPDADELTRVVVTLQDAKATLDLFHATTVAPKPIVARAPTPALTPPPPVRAPAPEQWAQLSLLGDAHD